MEDNSGSEDKEKLLYLTQIRYLDEQLERCQCKCDELEKQNKDLVCLYSALEKDKKGITEFLKHSVAAEEKKVEELVVRLENQQQAAEQDREALKLQHRQVVQELQERIDELKSETAMQILSVTEIEEQKEKLRQPIQQLPDVESLGKQLVSQREEHEAATHRLMMEAALEMKKIIEGSQNREDNWVQTELSKIRRGARAQHSEMLEMLQFLQSENMHLQKEMDILRDRGRDLQVRRDDLKKDLNKINQESPVHKEEVEQLRMKCQQQTAEQKHCNSVHQHSLAQIESLRQCLASVSNECCQKTAEADQRRTELQKEKSRIKQLGGVMQEAAVLLRHILMDSEKVSKPLWKIQRLLEILESTAPRGTDSTTSDPTEKSSRGQKPQTSGPRPARKLCRQKTSSSVNPTPQGQEPPALQTAEPDPVNSKKDECSSSHRSISK